MKIAAIVLIVVGVIALAYGGISYTREKKVIDIGPIEATAKTRETIPLPRASKAEIAGRIFDEILMLRLKLHAAH